MKHRVLKVIIILLFAFSISGAALAEDVCYWVKPEILKDKEGNTPYCPAGSGQASNIGKTCTGKPAPDQMCCCKTVVTGPATPKFKLPDYTFQIPIGSLSTLTTVDCTNGSCSIPFISQYILAIYNYGLTAASVIAVLILMAAGLLWIVSGGDSGKITKAKQMIFGSVTGLLLLVSLNLFLTFINPDLVKMKNINIDVIREVVMPDHEVVALGDTPYADECAASRKGDFSLCQASATANKKPNGLVMVEGKEVDATVAAEYKKAMVCVEKINGKSLFFIGNSWRGPAKQIKYYADYKAGGTLASLPCCSNHGSGKAMDIYRKDGKLMNSTYSASVGLTKCMNDNGLYSTITIEPWHWSITGN